MMNPHNKPSPSSELQILNHLHHRMELLPQDKHHYENLWKGYRGEVKFYELLNKELTMECIILYDLLLESNQTLFQIDSLCIYEDKIFLFEVKNFSGNFYIQGEKLYVVESKKEISNPFHQLERSEFLLRTLLQQLGYNYSITRYVVFINDAFTLYNAPVYLPAIFPTQLSRFINKLNTRSAIITQKHQNLAKRLVDLNSDKMIYDRLPQYDYLELRKGAVCKNCPNFLSVYNYLMMRCQNCGTKEDVKSTILRNVNEFNLLFPNQKMTTQAIYAWCEIISKKTIRRVLKENLELIRRGRYTYYTFKT